MCDIFKTVLMLSSFGFGMTAVLLVLKPVAVKKLSAGWQYCVWGIVLLSMVLPAYKLIPKKGIQELQIVPQNQTAQTEIRTYDKNSANTIAADDIRVGGRKFKLSSEVQIRLLNLAAYIWAAGVLVFLFIVAASYFGFLKRKRKNGVKISDNALLEETRKELKLRRHIALNTSADITSPMLAGVLFPTVYIPCRSIPADNLRMVFLHELTHYRRKDLLVKWLAILINAIHWFNPLCYLARANLSETCETVCDAAVTRDMSMEEKKLYMQTILDFTGKGGSEKC